MINYIKLSVYSPVMFGITCFSEYLHYACYGNIIILEAHIYYREVEKLKNRKKEKKGKTRFKYGTEQNRTDLYYHCFQKQQNTI